MISAKQQYERSLTEQAEDVQGIAEQVKANIEKELAALRKWLFDSRLSPDLDPVIEEVIKDRFEQIENALTWL